MNYKKMRHNDQVVFALFTEDGEPFRNKEGKHRYYMVESRAAEFCASENAKKNKKQQASGSPEFEHGYSEYTDYRQHGPFEQDYAQEEARAKAPRAESAQDRTRQFTKLCPVCSEDIEPGDAVRPPHGGRWVHKGECEELEVERVATNAAAAQNAAKEKQLFDVGAVNSAFYKAPRLETLTRVPGKEYTEEDIVRLLSRSDEAGFKAVQRMMALMLERQTENERMSGTTHVQNKMGFSKPHAKMAAELIAEFRANGYSPELHQRMSSILYTYRNSQLKDIMSAKAAERNEVLKTNPGRMADFVGEGETLRFRDLLAAGGQKKRGSPSTRASIDRMLAEMAAKATEHKVRNPRYP